MGKVILGLFVFSLLPIWRDATMPNVGRNFWDFLFDQNQPGMGNFGYPHIPYDEAVTQAQQAYLEVYSES